MRQVLDTLGNAISAAYNGASITPATANKVFPGWPNQDDLTQIVKNKSQQISLFALPGTRNATEWLNPQLFGLSPNPTPTVTATISGKTITIGGAVVAGVNLHTIVKLGSVFGHYDALYQTVNGDSPTTVAAGIAAAIRAASIPGVSASSAGAVVTLTGPVSGLKTNIAQGSITAYQMARRVKRRVQVSVWSWSPDVRDATVDAILTNVATRRNPWLQAADGSWIKFDMIDDFPSDAMGMETQFIHHTIVEAEYTQLQTVPSIPVGVTEMTVTPTDGPATAPSFTIVDGG